MNTYDNKKIEDVKWTKYKIVVPTQEDRQELMKAFNHIHYSDVDSNFVAVNQLMHEYLDGIENPAYSNNIIVDKEMYDKLC